MMRVRVSRIRGQPYGINVRVCVCARVCVCLCVCVRACMRAGVRSSNPLASSQIRCCSSI